MGAVRLFPEESDRTPPALGCSAGRAKMFAVIGLAVVMLILGLGLLYT